MISVIMPVHNTGNILKESIPSILNQTYLDFELICVDDCSTDEVTCNLLEEYRKKDSRIRILRQERNVGAAEARNIGMKASDGEFLLFLDSDDIFDETMLEDMYTGISQSGADICICGHRVVVEGTHQIAETVAPRIAEHITDKAFSMGEFSDGGLMFWWAVPWNKMCRRDFLFREGIVFQSLPSANDVYFSYMCSLAADKIAYCSNGKPLLSYRVGNECQISARRNPFNFWKAMKEVLERRKNCCDAAEYRKIFYALVEGSVWEIKRCSDDTVKKEYYEFISNYLKEQAKEMVFDDINGNQHLKYFIEEKYESGWIEESGNYDLQLEKKKQSLLSCLKPDIKIIIWGNGKRGLALQRFCKKYGIHNLSVTDKKNDLIGKNTEMGIPVIHTDKALKDADLIIASNKEIYNELCNVGIGIELIDLVQYCPVS